MSSFLSEARCLVIRACVVTIGLLSVGSSTVTAQPFADWQAGLGTWSTPSNWNCGPDFQNGCVPDRGIPTTIGNGGTATLDIDASAQTLAITAGGLVVSGNGSALSSPGAINVGLSNGNGTLTIQNGATVSSGRDEMGTGAFIGLFSGTGAVKVSGTGSTWNSTGAIYVGMSGNGTLTIDGGGQVTANERLYVGFSDGSIGTVSVSGGQSRLNVSGTVSVGGQGTGILNVQDGAEFSTSDRLGIGFNGTGSVNVASAHLNAGDTFVGPHGSLIIDQSIVDVLGDFTLMPGGLLSLDVAGTTPDLISQLSISGFGLFQGIIDIEFINGFAPHAGDQFDLINALGGRRIIKKSFQILGLQPGFEYSTMFSGDQFTLVALNDGVSTTPEPGTLQLIGLALLTTMVVSMRRSRLVSHSRRLRWSSY